MTTIYFIRHGQSIGNLDSRFLGQSDMDLSGLGYLQAQKTALYFADKQVDAVYSSDLIRSFNTVSPIAVMKGLNVIPVPELREIECGEWQGLSFDTLRTRFADDYRVWLSDIGNAVCTGGESVAALQSRADRCIRRIAEENDGRSVVIGTHATPIRCMTCVWRSLPLDEMKNIGWVPNASVTTVTYENGVGRIVGYGDNAHLGDMKTSFVEGRV